MAKPRSIPGLTEDDAYAAAAARVVRVRTAELAENAAGVLDVDEPMSTAAQSIRPMMPNDTDTAAGPALGVRRRTAGGWATGCS